MRVAGEERREFQRLRVDPPIPATLGSQNVSIIEIGVLGVRIRHEEPIAGDSLELKFTTDDDVILRCELVRTTGQAPSLQTGVRFLAAVGNSGDRLRDLLARRVADEFEIRRKMPRDSIPTAAAVDGDKTVRGKDAAFVCFRLEKGQWRRRAAFLPEQPVTGFTVARWVEPAETGRLCQVYQAADEEGRRLIQLFAELSVSDELEIPPRA